MNCEYISVKCNMYNIRIFQSDRFLRGTEGFRKQLDGQFRRHYQNIAAAVAVSDNLAFISCKAADFHVLANGQNLFTQRVWRAPVRRWRALS